METPEAAGRLEQALAKSRKTNPAARPETTRREGTDLVVAGGMPVPGAAASGR
jgi:hypothetical protein